MLTLHLIVCVVLFCVFKDKILRKCLRVSLDFMQKIAVLVLARPYLGDTIIYIPFFQNIRSQYPQSKILVFSPYPIIEILKDLDLFDEVILYDRKKALSVFKPLHGFKPDLIFNFRTSNLILNLLCLSCRNATKIGLMPKLVFRPIYHYKLKNDKSLYQAELFLKMLQNPLFKPHFGFQKVKELTANESPLPESFNERTNICFIPGGGAGEFKRWGIQNFIALSHLIEAKIPNVLFHFIVGPKEEDDMKIVEATLHKNSYVIHKNEKITKLIQIIQKSSLTIANDCGPSHLAQICEVNYIGLWGWREENPQLMGGWSNKSKTFFHIMPDQNQDIKKLKPEKVFELALSILKK